MNLRPGGEHEFEAARGLPEPLPPGERLLWQGSPDWWRLARDTLHWRALAVYFTLLLAWQAAVVVHDGGGALQVARALAVGLPLALAALAIVAVLAWLIARTATYTLTDRRIVLSIGVVLSLSFNVPLSQITGAGLRRRRDGSGDIALALAGGQRIAYLHLWPHVRPWRIRQTQPMLRALADAAAVGALLTQAATHCQAEREAR